MSDLDKLAEEYADSQPSKWDFEQAPPLWNYSYYGFKAGYRAALTGPEVKGLVEALDLVNKNYSDRSTHFGWQDLQIKAVRKSLTAYRASVEG